MLSLEVGGSARAMKPAAHHLASPSKEETDRLRAMSSGLSLALGSDTSFPIHSSRPFPVQLDLLPRSPAVAQQPPISCSSQASRPPHLHPLFAAAGRMSPSTAVAASPNDCLEIVQVAASETQCSSRNGSPGPRGLDMNEIPPCDAGGAATATAAVSSPRSSMSPPFPLDMRSGSPSIKREREKPTITTAGLDQEADRTCEVSSRGSDEEDGAPRKKLRLSKEQSALLEESFKEHSTLNPKQKSALAKQLNLRPRQVEVWFQNRRARTKLKQTEIDCELLKRCCETLTEENRRLQKEVQELRAIKVPPPCVISQDFYMPLPAATLTMCPSCERLATVDGRSATGSLPLAAAAAAKAQSFHHFSPSQAQHQHHQQQAQHQHHQQQAQQQPSAAAACHS